MTLTSNLTIAALACALLFGSRSDTQQGMPADSASMPAIHRPQTIEWQDGPPALPAGAQFAVLEGDPTQEGAFTMRIKLPDGYRVPPHTHPAVEHITVMRGTFHLGMGAKFEAKATEAMPAGTFGYWPAGMQHFAWAKGETVVQLHGIGPWKIEYVDPSDDPRNAAETEK